MGVLFFQLSPSTPCWWDLVSSFFIWDDNIAYTIFFLSLLNKHIISGKFLFHDIMYSSPGSSIYQVYHIDKLQLIFISYILLIEQKIYLLLLTFFPIMVQVRLMKELYGNQIGELYHSLPYHIIEFVLDDFPWWVLFYCCMLWNAFCTLSMVVCLHNFLRLSHSSSFFLPN